MFKKLNFFQLEQKTQLPEARTFQLTAKKMCAFSKYHIQSAEDWNYDSKLILLANSLCSIKDLLFVQFPSQVSFLWKMM